MYIMFDMVDNAYNYGRALIGNFFRNTAFLLRGQKEAIAIQKQGEIMNGEEGQHYSI